VHRTPLGQAEILTIFNFSEKTLKITKGESLNIFSSPQILFLKPNAKFRNHRTTRKKGNILKTKWKKIAFRRKQKGDKMKSHYKVHI
jgi:hypothetical protein